MTTEFRHDRVAVYPSGNVVLAGNPRFARECESRGARIVAGEEGIALYIARHPQAVAMSSYRTMFPWGT